MSSRIRCFVAVDVEEPAIVARITRLQSDLSSTGSRLKLVEPENLHFTLRFIGEVPASLVERAAAELEGLQHARFTVRLRGVGAFPNLTRPHVIWIGVSDGSGEMQALAEKVDAALRRAGLSLSREEFVPHLTIARVKSASRGLQEALRTIQDADFGEMPVTCVRLKKSTLTPRGPIYETLAEKSLG